MFRICCTFKKGDLISDIIWSLSFLLIFITSMILRMSRLCCIFKRRDLISPDPGSHFRQPSSPEDLSCAILGQEEMIIQIQNAKTGIQMQRPAVKLETDLKNCKSRAFGKGFGDTYILESLNQYLEWKLQTCICPRFLLQYGEDNDWMLSSMLSNS